MEGNNNNESLEKALTILIESTKKKKKEILEDINENYPYLQAFLKEELGSLKLKERIKQKLPSTVERVPRHTSSLVQDEIQWQTEQNIAGMVGASRNKITRRLKDLDSEWDIERILETNASTLALSGLVLSFSVDRRWSWLSAGVLMFLFQHAAQGWCPPVPVLRRAGVRTSREIDEERNALKQLRGDFDEIALEEEMDPYEIARHLLEAQRK